MRLIFAGTPEVAVPSLDALLASDHEVVAVLTRPDARAGRGPPDRSVAGGVARRGGRHRDPQGQPGPASPTSCRPAARAGAGLRPVVAYGALVPPALLDVPAHGWVNLHFSLLPAWRGAAPVQHAILHGDEVTGATRLRARGGAGHRPGASA